MNRCTRCHRRQVSPSSCGLCGSPTALVVPLELELQARGVVDALAHDAVYGRRAASRSGGGEPPVVALVGGQAPSLIASEGLSRRAQRAPLSVGETFARPRLELVPPVVDVERELEGDAPSSEPSSGAAGAARTAPRLVSLATVRPDEVTRQRVNWGDVDYMLGGGVPLERVIVVGGAPGIGKSTLMLAILARLGGPVVFKSTEGQTQTEIARMVAQSGADPSRVFLLEEATTIEDVAHAAIEVGARGVIVDSVQGIETEARMQPHARDRYLVELGTDLATALEAVVVFVSQRAKDGSNLGTQKLPQLCGTVLELAAREDGAIELYAPTKNRGGPIDLAAQPRRAAFRFDDAGNLHPEETSR